MTDVKFGFADDSTLDNKEPEFKYSDTLACQNWKNLKIGQRVKSMNNGAVGSISFLDEGLVSISIDWDNGNKSRASKTSLNKVIIWEDKPSVVETV